jgi:hypothetical protein
MRTCAKMRCTARPVATIAMRYEARQVIVRDLIRRPDPNLLDLCSEHLGRLRAPLGWSVHDARSLTPVP